MADGNDQPRRSTAIQIDREQHPDPPARPMIGRVAAKVQLAGGACLHFLARPSAAVPLILTCVCLAIAYKIRGRSHTPRRRRYGAGEAAESIRPVLQRSMSVAVLHGGHVAMQRIIDSQEARLNAEILENAEAEFEDLLHPSDGRMHFGKLQSVAGKLEMSGKEDEAVVHLKKAMLKAKPHEAHELGMLLVEMLIYKILPPIHWKPFISSRKRFVPRQQRQCHRPREATDLRQHARSMTRDTDVREARLG